MWESKLDEKRKKDICKCENCETPELSHFERCPKCFSEAYHTTTLSYKEESDEENN